MSLVSSHPWSTRPFGLALAVCSLVGCGGLDDLDKYIDSGGPTPVGDAAGGDGSGGDGATDTGFTGGSGSGSGGEAGSGSGSGGGTGGGEAGTGSGSGTDDGGGDDGTVEPIEIAIDGVTPDYGITAGGDVVVLTGGPFDSTAVVTFGGAEATVSSVTETQLTVVTPASSAAGVAAVEVTSDVGSGRLSDAFEYWEDARGLNGMIGLWEGGTPADVFSALAYFSTPTSSSWYELYAPSLDTCRSETWTSSASISVYDPGVPTISLRPTSGATITLDFDSPAYVSEPTSLTAGARYELLAPGGIFPGGDVADVVKLPSSGPSVTSPSISSSSPPSIGRYQTFTWSPIGADWVLITMTVENGQTSDGYERVSCVVTDDGSFAFDGSQFSLWPTNAVAIVSVSFVYDQPGGTLPWNQGNSGMAGIVSTVGGGYTD
jgi:hypothetical protein